MAAKGKDRQLVVRMESEVRDRIERLRGVLSKRAGGAELTLSAVVREVIDRGLEHLEKEVARR